MTERTDATPAVTAEQATCKWDGCTNSVQARQPGTAGRPSQYCEQPGDDGVVHNRINYFKAAKRQQSGAGTITAPHSTARQRAQHLADQIDGIVANLLTAGRELGEQLTVAAATGSARIEIEGYERQARTAQDAADAAVEQAEAAGAATDQALEELEAEQGKVRELTTRLADAARDHADQLRTMSAEHAAEVERAQDQVTQAREAAAATIEVIRAEAEEAVRQAGEDADRQVAAARDEAGRVVEAAEEARTAAVLAAEGASREASAANGRAEAVTAEFAAARAGFDRDLDRERGRADRLDGELRQAGRELAEAQATLTGARAELRAAGDRADRAEAEAERERGRAEQGAADRQHLADLYTGQIADLRATVEGLRDQTARAEHAAASLRAELDETRRAGQGD